MKIVVISPKNRSVYNFRGDLIKKMINLGHEVTVLGPDKTDVDKILDLGARFIEVPINKNGLNPFSDLKYIRELKKIFKEIKPDITFGYTVKPVIYGSIAAKKAKVPHKVSMITGLGYTFTSQTFKARIIKTIVKILYRRGLKASDAVIFQNRDDLEEIVNLKLVERDKTFLVNGSGVNMEKYYLAPMPKEITFFMLARILYSKGVLEYLEAAEILKNKYPHVKFMLLGAVENLQDSIPKDKLDYYINNKIIDYYGETEDVRKYFKMSSVFVLPSYREGTPRTVLEAMSMGRPIITTNAPGCRGTVIDGETGFLIPVKNVNALVDKMTYFIENPEEIKIMGMKSHQYCQEKFEINKVNDKMLEIMKIKDKGE